MNEETHKRRAHYAGKYPRKFEEKYKELNPEKYGETVRHVMEKGSTPAGMHLSIMVPEVLEVLSIRPGQRGLDATLGYGGHTEHMLRALGGKGHLTALDIDPIESQKTAARLRKAGYGEDILTIRNLNFARIDRVAEEDGPFDFVLADLGVSSMQIDDPKRGFSYKIDGPLDLRMDPLHGESAAERLHGITEEEFEGMLRENSDEPYAAEIAGKVFSLMKKGDPMDTTRALYHAVEEALWKEGKGLPEPEKKELISKAARRTFQALRIDVNSEFESLYAFLEKLPSVLSPGGRAAILTFHSGEDRLVKKSFKEFRKNGWYSEISDTCIRPSAEECRGNGRAHSTKLRYAVRSAEQR